MDEGLVRAVPHGDHAAHRCRTLARHLLSGTRPARDLAELAVAVAAPRATGRRIAVVSARGGAGKTTLSTVLAHVFAARRADPVLVVDADPLGGSLVWRLGMPAGPSLEQLAPTLLTAPDAAAARAALGHAGTALWVVPGGSHRPELARDVTRALSRFFPVAVLDCAGGLTSPGTAAVLGEAHGIVLVAPATPDGVRSTAEALQGAAPSTMARIVVALNVVHPAGRRALRGAAARDLLGRHPVPVVWLPHDRHLAGAAPVVASRVGEAATTAVSRLAAVALDRALPLW
jgi:MinD-like ATPase involved in chromosome partitioning or flagellar assembly